MVKGETKSGFKFKIDEKKLSKYSFIKMINEVDKNPTKIADLMSMMLGDQEEALIKHLGGDPEVTDMTNELTEIFNLIRENNDVKNS